MTYRRGEIVLVLFPDSNLRTAKRRPALIVQANDLDAGLAQTVVAMITSNMSRGGHPSRVIVRANDQTAVGSSLLLDSIIMADDLATIHHSEIDRAIGSLASMAEVDAALRTTLAL